MRYRTVTERTLAVFALAALCIAGCGDDDTDDGTSTSTGTSAASGEPECSPVNQDLEGDAVETIEIELTDYAFNPSMVSAGAGIVTFVSTNSGTEDHELAFLPGGGDVPFTADGAPDEAALEEAGAFELEAFGPGQSCNATYELEPGTYTLFCIVEAEDGETHYEKGMTGTLTVG